MGSRHSETIKAITYINNDDFENFKKLKNIDYTNKYQGQRVLWIAFEKNNTKILKYILSQDSVDWDCVPIYSSITIKNLEIVTTIFNHEKYKVYNDYDILYHAAKSSTIIIVKFIIEHQKFNMHNVHKHISTILDLTIANANYTMFKFLYNHPKVELSKFGKKYYKQINALIKDTNPATTTTDIQQKFIDACQANDSKTIMTLLFNYIDKLDINNMKIDGKPVLVYCLVNNLETILKMLMNHPKVSTSDLIIASQSVSLSNIKTAIQLLTELNKEFDIELEIK